MRSKVSTLRSERDWNRSEKGCCLKKKALRKWIYRNGYTQPIIAKKMHLPVWVLKHKLRKRQMFHRGQIKRLIEFMGARSAVKVIYFPTNSKRKKVEKEILGRREKMQKEQKTESCLSTSKYRQREVEKVRCEYGEEWGESEELEEIMLYSDRLPSSMFYRRR